MRVLLIEDDALLGPMLKRALTRRGHEVTLCTTIQQGMVALESAHLQGKFPDRIVCDRELPDGDAWTWSYNEGSRWDVRKETIFRYMSGNPREPTKHPYYYKGADDVKKLYQLIENS